LIDVATNIFITLFGVFFFLSVILIHEAGHFFTAKLSGIRVNEFAIGMGPKIFSFKRSETLYTIRALPIGGFCAMEGEDEKSNSEDSFNSKSVWARILVISAGAILNILLGLLLNFILLAQKPCFASMTIEKFADNSVSEKSGLQASDTIKYFNGYSVSSERDLNFAISTTKSSEVNITVERNGKKINLDKVEFGTEKLNDGKEYIKADFFLKKINKNIFSWIVESFKDTVSTVKIVWFSTIGLITGKINIKEVSGPIGIVTAVGKAASTGLQTNILKAVENITFMMMLITVNLGVFNLFPLPALDGGRLVFLVIEALTKKHIPRKYEGLIHATGLILLILTMVVFSFGDIVRIIKGG
jgi:regulator of sigma E protease